MNAALLQKDYAYCEKIIKKSSKSFYTAFSKLPKEKATAVYAIYAFCRLADDTVDEAGSAAERAKRLYQLEEQLVAFSEGETPDHPMWRALRDVFERFQMDVTPFFEQLEGQKRDLSFSGIESIAALEEYSYYVAGTVGLMLLPILAAKQSLTPELKESAVCLGIAMQLTNILRDVGEDFEDNDRIYLPADKINAHRLDLASLMQTGPTQSFVTVWEEVAALSEAGYEKFYQQVAWYDNDCRLAITVSAKLYASILDSVRGSGYDCLHKRNFVPEVRMLQLIKEVKETLTRERQR